MTPKHFCLSAIKSYFYTLTSNPFLNMNLISSFAFTITSCTRLLQIPASNSWVKPSCFSKGPGRTGNHPNKLRKFRNERQRSAEQPTALAGTPVSSIKPCIYCNPFSIFFTVVCPVSHSSSSSGMVIF